MPRETSSLRISSWAASARPRSLRSRRARRCPRPTRSTSANEGCSTVQGCSICRGEVARRLLPPGTSDAAGEKTVGDDQPENGPGGKLGRLERARAEPGDRHGRAGEGPPRGLGSDPVQRRIDSEEALLHHARSLPDGCRSKRGAGALSRPGTSRSRAARSRGRARRGAPGRPEAASALRASERPAGPAARAACGRARRRPRACRAVGGRLAERPGRLIAAGRRDDHPQARALAIDVALVVERDPDLDPAAVRQGLRITLAEARMGSSEAALSLVDLARLGPQPAALHERLLAVRADLGDGRLQVDVPGLGADPELDLAVAEDGRVVFRAAR